MRNGKKKIIVLEQEPNLAKGFKSILDKENYVAVCVDNCLEMYKHFQMDCPDLAIINLGMPSELGINIVLRLKETYPALPIIVVAGYGRFLNERHFALCYADEFIEKPFDEEHLKSRIKELIRSEN